MKTKVENGDVHNLDEIEKFLRFDVPPEGDKKPTETRRVRPIVQKEVIDRAKIE